MKKLLILIPLALLIGCANLSTHVFRMEQTAVDLAYGGYIGWTNYLFLASNNPKVDKARLTIASNEVKQARLKFAATVSTLEAIRISYETNSALEVPLRAGIQTMVNESSNVCWLIKYWRSQ